LKLIAHRAILEPAPGIYRRLNPPDYITEKRIPKMTDRIKILFVCGRNRWRSPTAERIYRDDPRVSVRSGGVNGNSRREVSENDLDWADLVLVMERRYTLRIKSRFHNRESFPPIESLEIQDDYAPMNQELISLIRVGTEHHITFFQLCPTDRLQLSP
jgi:predicted protein tyrosine phosphatase